MIEKMTLKKYAKEINKLAKKYPNAVPVFALDESMDEVYKVAYNPEAGDFSDGIFRKVKSKNKKVNAVCIN